jgi:beta-ribofuranosylaminobenzene 5'-phosphate synthase
MLPTAEAVYVEAPARLHFGVLDLRGSLGRWFGGIGAAAPAPTLLLSASPAATLKVHGEDASRAEAFAQRFLDANGITTGARIDVQRALPRHAGLGSGTQLALSVARALADLNGIVADAPALACAVGRARRSAVGTWTFAGGGLVLEGGRRGHTEGAGPLLARIPFPPEWQCVIALPLAKTALHGIDEEIAFAALPLPPEGDVQQVAHLTMMALLPALVEANLPEFGAALTRIQQITGAWFAGVQGGAFANGVSAELARRMMEWQVPGIGQSSWGPTVYGIVEGRDAAQRLAERLAHELSRAGGGEVHHGPFPTEGARARRVGAVVTRQSP